MYLNNVEIAPRVDNKFNVWASVDYFELFGEKRDIAKDIKVYQWVPIQVEDTLERAIGYCSKANLKYTIISKKH